MLEAKIQSLIVVSGDKHVDGIIQIFNDKGVFPHV